MLTFFSSPTYVLCLTLSHVIWLVFLSRSEGVVVLEAAGGLRKPVLLLMEVEGLWSPALLRSGAGFCTVLTSLLSWGLRCFALGCLEGFRPAWNCVVLGWGGPWVSETFLRLSCWRWPPPSLLGLVDVEGVQELSSLSGLSLAWLLQPLSVSVEAAL